MLSELRETSLTDVLTRESDWQAQPLRAEQLFGLSDKIFANEATHCPFLIVEDTGGRVKNLRTSSADERQFALF